MRLVDLLASDAAGPEERILFLDALNALPKDSREILKMIFKDPHKYICSNPTRSTRRLRKYVRHKFGWSKARTTKGIRSIRTLLRCY